MELEEPDSRTAALGRGQEYLYGFEASALPKGVLDTVEEAGAETRRLAYERYSVERLLHQEYSSRMPIVY